MQYSYKLFMHSVLLRAVALRWAMFIWQTALAMFTWDNAPPCSFWLLTCRILYYCKMYTRITVRSTSLDTAEMTAQVWIPIRRYKPFVICVSSEWTYYMHGQLILWTESKTHSNYLIFIQALTFSRGICDADKNISALLTNWLWCKLRSGMDGELIDVLMNYTHIYSYQTSTFLVASYTRTHALSL